MNNTHYKFGNFVLYVENRRLFSRNKVVQLSARAFDILLFLVERRGTIVEKDELLRKIWSDVFVEEINLAVHICAIRRILGKRRGENKFIETFSGRGYSFVAPVEEVEADEDFSLPETFEPVESFAENKIYALAVLTFTNDGGAKNLEYLTDGITESLINILSPLPQLKVFARNAVFQYKNQNPGLQEIGFLLGAEIILTGHILKINKRLVVSVELINVFDLTHIWGFVYDCVLADIFKVKTEISLAIAEKLQIKLSKSDALSLKNQPATDSEEAYKLYLKGRYLLAKITKDDLLKASQFFERALKKDSSYALAYTGIADACYLLGVHRHYSSSEIIPKAKIAIERSLALDKTLSEAHASNANIQFRYEWKWKAAEKSFQQAIALNPNNAAAHHWYGSFLICAGRFRESLPHLQKALELDPFSLYFNIKIAFYLGQLGEYGKAVAHLEEMLEIAPDYYPNYFHLSISYAKLGLFEKAAANAEKALSLFPSSEGKLLEAWVYASAGNQSKARRILKNLLAKNPASETDDCYDIAAVHTALGEPDKALNSLEKAIKPRDLDLCALKIDPRFEPLRREPRFLKILEKIGLA